MDTFKYILTTMICRFYGYALVNPQMFDSPYVMMGADSSGRVDSGRYFRNVNSSAAQTRIGHIFS